MFQNIFSSKKRLPLQSLYLFSGPAPVTSFFLSPQITNVLGNVSVKKVPAHLITVPFFTAFPRHCRIYFSPQLTDVSGYFFVKKAPTQPVTVPFFTASPSHCKFFLSPQLTDVFGYFFVKKAPTLPSLYLFSGPPSVTVVFSAHPNLLLL
jgi:hypothetical protein